MKNTTLCYLERDGCYLMLHRTKKNRTRTPANGWAWAASSSPAKARTPAWCAKYGKRQALPLQSWHFHGVVSFLSDVYETEQMFLFTSERFFRHAARMRRGRAGLGGKKKRWRACLCGRGTGCSSGFWNRGAALPAYAALRREHLVQAVCNGKELPARDKKSSEYGSAPCAQAFGRARALLFGKKNRRHAGGYRLPVCRVYSRVPGWKRCRRPPASWRQKSARR